MGMTPKQYFSAFVVPNQSDCHQMPGDIRRAFNAAVSASHLADHYFHYNSRQNPEIVNSYPDQKKFLAFLSAKTNGAFRDIRSISNAYKHLYSDNGPHARYSSINSCGSIERLEMQEDNNLSEMEEDYLEPENQDSRLAVVFTRKDGSRGEFIPALDIVVDFFEQLLYPYV